MKKILVVCDSYKQFREYVLECAKSTAIYVPVYDIHSVSNILGIERVGIEIRIIGFKAMYVFTSLKCKPGKFGVTE